MVGEQPHTTRAPNSILTPPFTNDLGFEMHSAMSCDYSSVISTKSKGDCHNCVDGFIDEYNIFELETSITNEHERMKRENENNTTLQSDVSPVE